MSITIKELTNVVAESTGLTKKASEAAISDLFTFIGAQIQEGNEVTVRDFGRFKQKTRAARNGRNPKTGDPVAIPEKQVIKFYPRGNLK